MVNILFTNAMETFVNTPFPSVDYYPGNNWQKGLRFRGSECTFVIADLWHVDYIGPLLAGMPAWLYLRCVCCSRGEQCRGTWKCIGPSLPSSFSDEIHVFYI